MKRGMVVLLAVSLLAFIAGGCANKDVVKTEQPVTPVTDTGDKAGSNKTVERSTAKEQPKQVESDASKGSAAEMMLEAIYFDYDKSDLSKASRDVLSKNAETLLKSKPDAKVKIEGHCDERGSAEYNLALGERRAKSALQYLLTLGVKSDRMSIISYGKEKPAVDGHDEAAWAKNRRDEFVIVK